jgi:hypothetical protein
MIKTSKHGMMLRDTMSASGWIISIRKNRHLTPSHLRGTFATPSFIMLTLCHEC